MQASPPDAAVDVEPGAAAWPVDRREASGPAWRWKAQAVGLAIVMAGLATLVALPLTWRIPEPRPIRLTGMQGQVSGTYLRTSDGLFKLVPYADRLPALPHNLPDAAPAASILVRARQLDDPQAYLLLTFDGDRAVAVERRYQGARTIALTPLTPLAPGAYYVKAAKDGADQADDYFYFRVK